MMMSGARLLCTVNLQEDRQAFQFQHYLLMTRVYADPLPQQQQQQDGAGPSSSKPPAGPSAQRQRQQQQQQPKKQKNEVKQEVIVEKCSWG
jgi:hypothetical protein